ncbi:MAG: glycogen synthase GlgA [bacterium]|nr:glycogen synthase GlgA [bacterium]
MKAPRRGVLRILFTGAEAVPWIKSGGLGDVLGALPRELFALGHEVATILPLYASVEREEAGLEHLATIQVRFQGVDFPTRIYAASYPRSECRAIFIENQYYFERSGIYDDPATGRPWPDDDERWFFFQTAVLELIRQTDMQPDLLVCADWHTALLPALLRIRHQEDRRLQHTRSVLSLHNLGYQGVFPAESITKLGLPRELLFPLSPFEFYGQLNCLKAGISFADEVVTVSPTYAREICQPELGHGLDGVLRQHGDRVRGILNGIDMDNWNPATDPLLAEPYASSRLTRKAGNRPRLLREFGLDPDYRGPVLAMVTRLTGQKGMNILAGCLDRLLARDLRLVILGTGEAQFEHFLSDVAAGHADHMAVRIGYSEALAHQIYGGADFFLMPSRYEPCGLSQMYAMRYGTLPIVHATGGLKDTVIPFLDDADHGTGFSFTDYNAEALLEAVDTALSAWRNPRAMRRLQKNAMKQDFSWEQSARLYEELFFLVRERSRWGE